MRSEFEKYLMEGDRMGVCDSGFFRNSVRPPQWGVSCVYVNLNEYNQQFEKVPKYKETRRGRGEDSEQIIHGILMMLNELL